MQVDEPSMPIDRGRRPVAQLGGDETLAGDEHSTVQPAAAPAREPARGDAVGRFVVLERLGGGSMGVVHAAYDPELDRKVALKLLHPRRSIGRNATDERRRLLREAQAIARVNHPHVIAIHDVGEHDGGVFLAMEYIDGPTLAQWLAKQPRSIAEITAVFAAAGRGLAAAHAKDLVHRDFKPDNVMLDDEGRVRVLDFGLVRTATDEVATPMSSRIDGVVGPNTDALASDPTDHGIVGTPAYMAPEQLGGHGVDARSDQFSFCVALYEAVYGVRPFVGRDIVTLGVAIAAGVVPPAPSGSAVPSWLRRLILRGLAVDKAARWPDMSALVDALAEDRTRGQTRKMAVVGIAAAACVLGVVVLGDSDRDRCADVPTSGAVWDRARRDALEKVVVADASDFRRETWSRVGVLLDARAESLQAATMAACVAAPRDALAAARQLCVARHRRLLDATITALFDADLDGLVAAVPTVEAIPDAIECDDAAALGDELAPPTEAIAERVQRARDDLARASADAALGNHAPALALAESTLAAARELGYRPLVAEAGRTVGLIQDRMVRLVDAEATLREAFAVAIEVGDDRLAVTIAGSLTRQVGEAAARPSEGLVWGEIGSALLRRGRWVAEEANLGLGIAAAHDRGGNPRAALAELRRVEQVVVDAGLEPDGNLLRALSNIHRSVGDVDAARRAIEDALERDTRHLGPEHPTVAHDVGLLGAVYYEQGEHGLAIEHYERSIATLERTLGAEHERLSPVLSNLATALGTRGDFAAALPYYERALAISTRSLGAEHPDTLDTASNIATLYFMWGDSAESIRRQLELLPIFERRFGRDHPSVAGLLSNLGSAEAGLGQHGPAIAHLERAIALAERSLGDDHIDVASALFNLAEAHARGGDPARAIPLLERSLAIYERRRGPDHVDLSWPLLGIGSASRQLGDHDRAIAVLQRAVSLRDAAQMSTAERGEARFELARALWARVDARSRAIALARTARAELADDAPAVARIDAQLEAWRREKE